MKEHSPGLLASSLAGFMAERLDAAIYLTIVTPLRIQVTARPSTRGKRRAVRLAYYYADVVDAAFGDLASDGALLRARILATRLREGKDV